MRTWLAGRAAVRAVVAVASLTIFTNGAAAAAIADCPVAGTQSATVAGVGDDGTLRLGDDSTARLAGIDIPRPPLTPAVGQPWPPGEAALAGLRRMVAGVPLSLAPATDSADRYGRRPVFAFLADGRSVAGEMVAAGLARARWLPGEAACFPVFLGREDAAREARLGLWGSPETAIVDADDPSLGERSGLYVVVEGRLLSVGRGAPMVFLDFGRNYRQDFTVLVSPEVARELATAGVSLDGLAGKRVRVRGVIEQSGGPAIRLNDRAELEVIDQEDARPSH